MNIHIITMILKQHVDGQVNKITQEYMHSAVKLTCIHKKNPRNARNLPAPHLSLGIRVPAIHIKGGSMGWSILGSCNKNSKPPMK
jgi:hypothetical protein